MAARTLSFDSPLSGAGAAILSPKHQRREEDIELACTDESKLLAEQEDDSSLPSSKYDADYSFLPPWAYSESVHQDAQERAQTGDNITKSRTTMHDVAGPALGPFLSPGPVKLAFYVTWAFLLAFQPAVWCTSTCVTVDKDVGRSGKQLVETPAWLIATFIPAFCVTKFYEWRSFKDMSIPLVQWVGKLTILGMQVPFMVWLIWEFILTTLASTSGPSQSLFMIQTWQTFNCEGGDDLLRFWRKGEGILPTDKIFGVDGLVILVKVAWALMWIQPLWALLHITPLYPNQVEYGARTMEKGYDVLMSLIPFNLTNHLFDMRAQDDTKSQAGSQIWHADAVQHLAEPTGMHSLRAFFMQYCLKRGEVAAYEDKAKEVRAFQIVGKETYRGVSAFGFQMVQMFCALEVHITLVSFDANRVGGAKHLDRYRVILPMICHFLPAVLQVADAVGRLWALQSFRREVEKMCAGSLGDGDPARAQQNSERAQHNSRMITLLMVALLVLILLYSVVLVDVFLKFRGILSHVPLPDVSLDLASIG